MINLLPPKYRQKLREEQRFRLVLLFGGMLGIALTALAIFLLVIQVTLLKERLAQESKLISFEERISKEDSVLSEIKNWNSKLQNIEEFKGKRTALKDVIEEIASSLPGELYLLSLSYTPSSEIKKKADKIVRTPAIIAVTGNAQTREQLLSFKDALQENPFFTEVVFPPSNWVKPIDIIFSFQAKLEKQP